MTFDELMERMLDRVPDTIDKREGSIIYDAFAPTAIELVQLYDVLEWSMNQVFADTANSEYLTLRAKERGLEPHPAKALIIKALMIPVTLQIPLGSRFNSGEFNFRIIENLGEGFYRLQSEYNGSKANEVTGALIPIDYVNGLQQATISEILTPGEDEEDTEIFRSRYMNSFSSFAFGGNVSDYKDKVNEIQGVGGVKVIPVWNGGGTVKIIFVSSDYKKPSSELVAQIQELVDPVANSGNGKGIAPVGHRVTVEGASDQSINISTKITLANGYTFDDVKADIETVLDTHYQDLAENWENLDNVIVRIATIQTLILGVDKVIDIEDTMINGQTKNIVLAPNTIAKRGDFIVT